MNIRFSQLRFSLKHIFYISLGCSIASQALAWGERGHDVVTRVAVQHLREMTDDNLALVKPFTSRDHMLAHLSNVPDIVWRAPYMSQQDRDANYTTHFINLERVYPDIAQYTDLPTSFSIYDADAKALELSGVEVGTAPWRIMQLYQAMVKAMQHAGLAETREQTEERVNQVLLYAGLMSHFVGDLANPHHTTANYDGQLTGQKGLHGYFESDVVAELPLDLAAKVSRQVAELTWLNRYEKSVIDAIESDPQKLVWALLAESHQDLDTLLTLDKAHSLLVANKDPKMRAERKAPKDVAADFESFAVQRLATGALVLSKLWLLAWESADKPDMSGYRSYVYPVQPNFIDPDYLEPSSTNPKVAGDQQSTWRTLDLDQVLVMQLPEGRVVMELAPQFAPKHVENILQLTEQGYFDGLGIVRSQENYVAQWGDPAQDPALAKPIGNAAEKLKVEFFTDPQAAGFKPIESRDAYAEQVGFVGGFPTASDGKQAWLTHCNGMLGVARGMGDDSGNGSGLYVVTGHAPRHLDRNVTLVGRVLEGMEHLTTLPRGTGPLGFYESAEEIVPIESIQIASGLPAGSLDIQVMRTDSDAFAEHVAARTTRDEDWFLEPTGRIELCNVSVPTRLAPAESN